MNKRFAFIDMGTNTFHLLIVELYERAHKPSFKILYKEKVGVKIGAEGGINAGYISEAAIQRALQTLQHFAQIIAQWQVSEENVMALGTSAVRNAKNQAVFIEKIKQETGILVTVISGDTEAAMIYEGVRLAVPLDQQPSLLIDIGGGSVEFILGNEKEMFWRRSFEIGGQRLMDLFMTSDPISAENVADLRAYLSKILEPLSQAVAIYKPTQLVGVSGSFDTLAEIYQHRQQDILESYDVENEPFYELPKVFVLNILQEIIKLNHSERLAMRGMIPLRADMIVVAAVLINYILQTTDYQKIIVSTYSLKEGLLSKYLS
ncbi:exopolyphosphatase / guanosine-5'-triphosphate,3'-diphosphate pyrophosphatase [Flexibacter flexilis DSM 6793]|uniref:Exopolyphosphatase / guanosine-5'-triphosphate,3'-diphosphate pyrophosphatase n=1 Tax=Flexibacter flexilis DSM 6793 TaxID=927664 RepID=A0A1I1KP45_9BACT|nr:hypothetical protein [Flexibacter flexilis]SFC59913.1 exopolyphosphatase / guanosine-5'-triphosphate,3'-diphosphate pyrophosphatase [Flexibacter flexilis DSM 6793]